MTMKIGILGSGIVGKTLAHGLFKLDYSVMIGPRDRGKLDDWAKGPGFGIKVGSFDEVAEFGDLLILCVKGEIALKLLENLPKNSIDQKTIIDTTNPIDSSRPPINGVLHYFTSHDQSLMEMLQSSFPASHFVKAFNSVGSGLMVNPGLSETLTMFICGNETKSKDEVKSLLKELGWEICDLGKVEAARAIEPLCMLWCIPGFINNQWTHAFRLVK